MPVRSCQAGHCHGAPLNEKSFIKVLEAVCLGITEGMRGSDVSLAFVVKFGAGYKTGRNINVGYIKLKKYIKVNWNNFYGRINANTLQ